MKVLRGLAIAAGVLVAGAGALYLSGILRIEVTNQDPRPVGTIDQIDLLRERKDLNLLFILIAVTIVVSLQTVGVALMMAMLVTPAATAYLLTNRLPVMMSLAAAIGAFSSLVGLYLSYYLNIASGSAIVLTATAVFMLVFALRRGKGGRA